MRSLLTYCRRIALALAAASLACSAGTILQRNLPNAPFVNPGAGANRANVAWLSGQQLGGVGFLLGDDFMFSSAGVIDSITVFEVANTPNPAPNATASLPTSEFRNITLFYGDLTNNPGLTMNTSSYSFQLANYGPGSIPYQSVPGGPSFNVYALTFGNLNWNIQADTDYGFAVGALPFNPNFSLFLAASNSALSVASGAIEDQTDDFVIEYFYPLLQGANPLFFDQYCDNTCPGFDTFKNTDFNVRVNGTLVPEPSTFGLAGLAALALFYRRWRTR